MRTCTACGLEKPKTDFWRDRSKKHGLSAKCKACKKAIYNRYRKERGYDKARYWKDPQGERERHLVRKYGVTQARYDEMFRKQNGQCAICQKSQERAFDVDHDHETGAVRGLLCTSCNRMLGHSGDDAERLEAGAAYLKSSRRSRPSSSAPACPDPLDPDHLTRAEDAAGWESEEERV